MKILISTGALIGRPNGRDFRLLTEILPKLNCDGVEFMMYSTWYDKVEVLRRFILDNKVPVVTFHCQKSIGEDISKGGEELTETAIRNFTTNARLASEFGAKKLVMHLWDGITSDSNFSNNIACYKKLKEIAEEHKVDLLVENVVCNVKDPLTHLFELREIYPDIHYIFDTKMAAFHGQLDMLYSKECEWLWKDGHIKHYHVNDYAGGYMDWANLRTLPIGAGNIDFERFFGFIKEIGYDDTLTLESTAFDSTGRINYDMLNTEVETVRSYLSR